MSADATPARLLEIASHLEERLALRLPVDPTLAGIPGMLREIAEQWQGQMPNPPRMDPESFERLMSENSRWSLYEPAAARIIRQFEEREASRGTEG